MATNLLKDQNTDTLDIEISASRLGILTMIVVGLCFAVGFFVGVTACHTLSH